MNAGVAKDEISRAEELQALGWPSEEVRRYAELWEYRHRWGAINLEPDDRAFLRRAEAALPQRSGNGKGSQKKTIQQKSHYRWLATYRDAMQAAAAEQQLAAGEQGAWLLLLNEELRLLEELQPVLGLPDTLKARELMAVREGLVASVGDGARIERFDFQAPLDQLSASERGSWKPLRSEAGSDSSYVVLAAAAVEPFRQEVTTTLGDWMRGHFPSLQS